MNDNQTTENPGTVNLSTTLDPGAYDTAYGAGKMDPKPEVKAEKPETIDDVLRDEMKKQDAEAEAKTKADKGEDKPDAKAEAKTDDKAEKPDAKKKPDPEAAPKEPVKDAAPARDGKEAAGREGEDKPPSEGKQVNAPARLLPSARDVWPNTPRAVQAEFARMETEHAAEIEAHKAAKQFHEELREYDGLAKGANTTVKAALDRYVNFDRQIAADFGKGMAAIAQDQRKSPQEAISGLLRAYGLTPQQYAQHVTQNPQAHQMQAQPQQQRQQTPQPDPVAQKAMQEVAQLRAELAQRDLQSQVIEPFAKAHPRLAELEEPIAKFLKSGMVPDSLKPEERLAAAYDMAERIYPPLRQPAPESSAPDGAQAPLPDAGRKSVRGAPDDGLMPAAEDTLPLEDWLRIQMRKSG